MQGHPDVIEYADPLEPLNSARLVNFSNLSKSFNLLQCPLGSTTLVEGEHQEDEFAIKCVLS